MVLHSKNPLSGDDAKEPLGHVGYTKEPSLMQKNPMPSKEPPVSQKNPKGSLSAAKEPSFVLLSAYYVQIYFSTGWRLHQNK